MPTETDLVLELLSHGGVLWIDSRDLPVAVTVSTSYGPRNFHGGSVAQALGTACRALKAKTKTEDGNV